MAEKHDQGREQGPFIVAQESLDDPAYLPDGNHRAVAVAYHAATDGGYDGQPAYVGVPPGEDAATLVEGADTGGNHPLDEDI